MSFTTVLPRLPIRGFTAALVLLSLLCGWAAPPPPPKPVAPPADIANQLQGTWHFHWTETGFNADFVFKPDGTFTEVAVARVGTWKVAGNKIVMTPQGRKKHLEMFLPIDPKGTTAHDDRMNTWIIAVLGATAQLGKAREFQLPSHVHDVVAGAGGRVLVLRLSEIKKLAVFDVVDLKVRGYINLIPESALVAAGLKHILVVDPDENIMRRYSLETLQAERTITSPFTENLTNLVMGYSSPRIAMAYSTKSGLKAFDAETMAVTGSSNDQIRQISDPMEIRASADGRTYGCTRHGTFPSGDNIVSFRNGQLSLFSQHVSAGILVPNSDGSLIYTNQGIYTRNFVQVLKRTVSAAESFSFFPSYHPMYFFGVPASYSSKKERHKPVAIYLRGSAQPLVYLPEAFEEMFTKEVHHLNWSQPLTMEDKLYHFYPQFNLFLTIPPTNDKIVVHPVNVRQVLIEKGIDYLYVTPIAPPAKLGTVYHYKLEAESKAGGIKFALQSGPEGLTVSADGNVAWTVPEKAAEESVIVSVKDASGREILHTFSIAITN